MPKVSNADILMAIDDFRKEARETYVTKDTFEPVRNVVYGMIGVVLLAVFGALVALVLRQR